MNYFDFTLSIIKMIKKKITSRLIIVYRYLLGFIFIYVLLKIDIRVTSNHAFFQSSYSSCFMSIKAYIIKELINTMSHSF